jgi:hypothetical protein
MPLARWLVIRVQLWPVRARQHRLRLVAKIYMCRFTPAALLYRPVRWMVRQIRHSVSPGGAPIHILQQSSWRSTQYQEMVQHEQHRASTSSGLPTKSAARRRLNLQ